MEQSGVNIRRAFTVVHTSTDYECWSGLRAVFTDFGDEIAQNAEIKIAAFTTVTENLD